mgnify:CR=1 FL=1
MNAMEIKHTSTVIYTKFNDGSKAYVKYVIEGDRMKILETYTPPQHRGKGIARSLMDYAVRMAKERGLLIEPICSYAIRYFIKNPDKRMLLAPEYRSVNLEELFRKRLEEESKKRKV